jgi:hypothetical protein
LRLRTLLALVVTLPSVILVSPAFAQQKAPKVTVPEVAVDELKAHSPAPLAREALSLFCENSIHATVSVREVS